MAAAIRRVLVAERCSVDVAKDGIEALSLAAGGPYDVIVLDRLMPGIDGLEVLSILRSRQDQTPVLMLTALGTVDQRVAGLESGADDYLVKPFAFSELLARIRALARRPPTVASEHLAAGDIELDPLRHRVMVGEQSADLSAREYALLGYLIRNQSHVVTRRQILDAVWGADPDVYSNVVDLYIHYLRRKLKDLGRSGRLRTVRGVGYSLAAP